jgi:hypothetical protein
MKRKPKRKPRRNRWWELDLIVENWRSLRQEGDGVRDWAKKFLVPDASKLSTGEMKALRRSKLSTQEISAIRHSLSKDNPKVLVAVDGADSVEFFQIEITHLSSATREKRGGGAPEKWGETEKLCAWLAVEVEHQLAKKTNPGIRLDPAMKNFFRRGRVLHINANGHPLIESRADALRYHRAGAALLRQSPGKAAWWENIRKIEVALRISAAQKLHA